MQECGMVSFQIRRMFEPGGSSRLIQQLLQFSQGLLLLDNELDSSKACGLVIHQTLFLFHLFFSFFF